MLNLKNITLIGIDCIDVDRLKKAIAICTNCANFGEIKLLTSTKTDYKYAVKIPHIGNIRDYSKFMIRDLHKHIDTEFALCVQWDGFILEPKCWTNKFLDYDYIGAVWVWNDDRSVGNGAFSLRSKKFLNICKDLPIKNYHPEDLILGRIYKKLLTDKGIKFAPNELAKQFSFEGNGLVGNIWRGNTFGFHDLQQSDISNWTGWNKFKTTLKMDY